MMMKAAPDRTGATTGGGQMHRKRRVVLQGGVLLTLALAAMASGAHESPAPDAIQVTARKYEFNPATITVKQGEHVKLLITATDHDHGFKLEEFNVEQRLPKGVPTAVEFTADKAGTFPFECSVVCGIGHRRMKGKLVVQAAGGGDSPSAP
jgi:cytochrome c oxidase subunit 2